ncbi:ATP-binding cassette domain-containing protein [Solimonas sp. K1W22B-7]|uniref:ABC transporter ATP-binding protein n=1 Tax=Solimonas sp. K1W22B-7 TaxID=2303331 RepID=UPI000E32D730|nr:oligopeptide/dipeptide ABC transporter ATP-binding protein [Solimonas sp. K1W22B-7]AXQ30798.1 ATP-binding cassette domain-containing protein [Solimonas sp. K1W22B-7]
MPLLEVEHLEISFRTPEGELRAVNDLSFQVGAGEALGVVGESGSGKSQTAMAIMGLLARNATARGNIRFDGQELLKLPAAQMNRIRGAQIGMVFQDPMTSLNPYLSIGTQMAEVLVQHRGMNKVAGLAESARMLDSVRIPDATRRLDQYPHELSGGMRQRVMIAMTLLCRPRLLIADEPTTALDVTVQAQILELLGELRREFGVAVLLISHDLGIVSELCERTLVMYAGQLMENGPTERLLTRPGHPYTRGLLDSRPGLDSPLDLPLAAIPGAPPDLLQLPPGCPFQPRCAQAFEPCGRRPPVLQHPGGVLRACHAA